MVSFSSVVQLPYCEHQWAVNKSNKVILALLSQSDISFLEMLTLGRSDQRV